jgi:uncharacterized DUF497 family protein
MGLRLNPDVHPPSLRTGRDPLPRQRCRGRDRGSTSQTEQRLRAIGKTAERRAIFVVFTLRRRGDDILIRPISARYMHDKEVKSYEKENPNL